MTVTITLRTEAELPARFGVDEDQLLTLALELQLLRLYEQGYITSTQASDMLQHIRRQIGKLLVGIGGEGAEGIEANGVRG